MFYQGWKAFCQRAPSMGQKAREIPLNIGKTMHAARWHGGRYYGLMLKFFNLSKMNTKHKLIRFILGTCVSVIGTQASADQAPVATPAAPPASMPERITSSPPLSSDDNTGRFGAGIILGEPTGLSVKYWLNDKLAIDGAAGFSTADHTEFYLHSDVLWHNFDLIPVPQGRMPVYFGIGALGRLRDDHQDNQVGIRFPVGVSYMFENAPVDVFVEVAPAIDVAPAAQGEITGGVGIRYWF